MHGITIFSAIESWLRARRHLTAIKTRLRPFLLGSLSLNQVADVYGQAHPEVATYNNLVQQMKGDFIDLTNQVDPDRRVILATADRLTYFPRSPKS